MGGCAAFYRGHSLDDRSAYVVVPGEVITCSQGVSVRANTPLRFLNVILKTHHHVRSIPLLSLACGLSALGFVGIGSIRSSFSILDFRIFAFLYRVLSP